MKKGVSKRTLKIEELDPFVGVYRGRGTFVTVWQREDAEEVYAVSNLDKAGVLPGHDFGKECVALWADTENPHVPSIEKVGLVDSHEYRCVYKMPLYAPLKAKHTVAWKQFKMLKKLREEVFQEVREKYAGNDMYWPVKHGHEVCYRWAERVEANVGNVITEELSDAVHSIVNAITSASGSMLVEVEKANMAVDEEGRLVLLDVGYDYEVIAHLRRAQINKYNGRIY